MKLPGGSTVVPIILSSDKTQLSVFSGDKTAYPLYMTIGNIDKSIRRKPTYGAQILIGYLPTTNFSGTDLTDDAARVTRARIFHHALNLIFEPLKQAAKDGVQLTSGDGAIRRGFPILACYVADYPEQCLVACTRYGKTCPKCTIRSTELGDNKKGEPRMQNDTLHTLRHANRLLPLGITRVDECLKQNGLTFVPSPFYQNWPHADIHSAITPDILHQLYQGLIKHIIGWLQSLIGEHELDMRFKRLPRTHGIRLFTSGISGLVKVSGNEHKDISAQLLGCLINAPGVPAEAIRATRALLDFLYIAQYESHTDGSLRFLQESLDEFHRNKDVFIKLGARLGKYMNFHSR